MASVSQSKSTNARHVLRNTVYDSTIAHIGRLHPAGVGIWIGHGAYNQISHNDVFDSYYTAISVGWQWGYAESRSHHNEITFNHLHNIGQDVLSDMGGVYTLGISPGTVVSNNWIHDVRSFEYGGWGLYTDEGSSDIVMKNNLVYGTDDGGFHQHYGANNLIENNIFAFGNRHQLERTNADKALSFTFKKNIVIWDNDSPLLDGQWRDTNVQLNHNIYWRIGHTKFRMIDEASFATWQEETGQDSRSLVVDPGFVDASEHDFEFASESPVTSAGFVPFDYHRAGRETPAVISNSAPKVPRAPFRSP